MAVYKKGKSWYVDFYLEGRRKRKRVGPSRRLAELALKDIQVKIAKSEYLGIHEPKRILFQEYAEEYLAHSGANKAASTHRSDCGTFRNHLIPFFGSKHLGSISTKTVEDYKQQRAARAQSPSTVNREMATLKHALSTAVKWGYIKQNPAVGVKLLRSQSEEPRYLTKEESRKLLEECPPHLHSVVVAALSTGMRKSELFHLRWSDVSFDQRTVTVRNRSDFHTRNYEDRTIPANDLLLETLRASPSKLPSTYVFPSKDGKPYQDLKKSFKAAAERAELGHVTFHVLRHTFASLLVMAGVDLRTVQALLGHKTIQMTMRYSHLAPDHLRGAVNRLDF